MPSTEVLVFIIAALLTFGLSIGGITLLYFSDDWREEPDLGPTPIERAPQELPRRDRAA